MTKRSRYRGRPAAVGLALGVLLLVLAALAAATFFVIAVGGVGAGQLLGGFGPATRLDTLIQGAPWYQRAALAAAALFAGVLALSLLLRRLRARTASIHMLAADDRGFVVIDSRGIATIAEHAAVATRGVLEAEVQVQGTGTSPVRIRVDLSLYPGADLKRAGAEAKEAVQQAVENLVGIGIRDVVVAVHVLESDALTQLLR